MSGTLSAFLYEQVLGWEVDGSGPSPKVKPHRDPFLRCMAWWMLGEHLRALDTLVDAGGSSASSNQSTTD